MCEDAVVAAGTASAADTRVWAGDAAVVGAVAVKPGVASCSSH